MKIALFYNLPAGGAKRALYEHVRHLKARGHVIDAYLLSSASEVYLPIRDVCENVFRYETPTPSDRLAAALRHPRMAGLWGRLGARGTARHAAAARGDTSAMLSQVFSRSLWKLIPFA